MARRSKSRPASGEAAEALRESAQKIWLAGLGAFERAKTEGPRMFEALVERGRNMGARAVGVADDALRNVRQASYGGRWDKLEQVFEARVAKSLGRLGVLTRREIEDLSKQVQELNATVREMMRRGAAKGGSRKARRAGAKKRPAGRRRAKRSTRASRARRA